MGESGIFGLSNSCSDNSKIESTFHYFGVEFDDALDIAEKIDI